MLKNPIGLRNHKFVFHKLKKEDFCNVCPVILEFNTGIKPLHRLFFVLALWLLKNIHN